MTTYRFIFEPSFIKHKRFSLVFQNIVKIIHTFSHGPHPIDRILKPTGLATLTSSWNVSLVNNKKNALGIFGFQIKSTVTIWPHILFSGLWQYHRKAFEKYILGGGPDVVKDFWAKMPPRPGMTEKNNWREKCVPLGLHGDGVAISNTRGKGAKSIDCLSWTSLLSADPTKMSVYLIWFCFGHLAKKSGFSQTWPAFWRKLCRSLQALWQGVWPDVDMEGNPDPRGGEPLAGGYCGIIYVRRGDLEFMASQFHLRHTSSSKPCCLCECSNYGPGQDLLPWTDCNDPPSWLESRLDDQAWEYSIQPTGNIPSNPPK